MITEYLERRRERIIQGIRGRYPDNVSEIERVALQTDMDVSEVDELILDIERGKNIRKLFRGYEIGMVLTATGGALALPMLNYGQRPVEAREIIGGVIVLAGIFLTGSIFARALNVDNRARAYSKKKEEARNNYPEEWR